MVRAYSLDEFTRLMRTGVPRDGRDLGMMGEVARSRFSHFSQEEIEALHRYLQSMEPAGGSWELGAGSGC